MRLGVFLSPSTRMEHGGTVAVLRLYTGAALDTLSP